MTARFLHCIEHRQLGQSTVDVMLHAGSDVLDGTTETPKGVPHTGGTQRVNFVTTT